MVISAAGTCADGFPNSNRLLLQLESLRVRSELVYYSGIAFQRASLERF